MTPDDPRHGTNAGYAAGCRLNCCRTGKYRAAKARQLTIISGGKCRYTHDELAQVVNPWLNQGITISAISNAAELAANGSGFARVWRNRAVVNRSTYERVAQLTEDDFPRTTKVHAALTRKRVYSLMAAGHQLSDMPLDIRGYWRSREYVWLRQAAAIREYYRTHQMLRGPNRHTSARALNAGHVLPLAWDDPGTLGWIGELPTSGMASNSRRHLHLEDVEWLLEDRPVMTAREIGERLHCSPDAVAAACRRGGRADLLARLARNADLRGAAA